VGDASRSVGLLPVTASASYAWTGGSANATVGNAGSFCMDTGTGYGCVIYRSDFSSFPTNTVLSVQAQFANPGMSFAKRPAASSVTVQASNAPSVTLSPVTLTGTMSGAGATGTVAFTGTYTGAPSAWWFWIVIPDIAASALTSNDPAKSAAYWFIANEWYRQTFYAVSTGFLPGGSGSCNPSGTPSCLTVSNLPPSYAVANDKRAILLLSGRTLNASTRPSSNPADYLEGGNTTLTDALFEHRAGVSTSINDRVVVVAP
jgi:hypothetical protein